MSLITASNLAINYGALDIFNNVSFALPPGARVGLVGTNGVGKTTLLRILTGTEKASAGRYMIASGAKIGFLPQDLASQDERSLQDFVLDGLGELATLRIELRNLEHEMLNGKDNATWQRYIRCQARYEALGGYDLDWKIDQTLRGLGFRECELTMPLAKLSGGQCTRAYLAQLLLREPDILLLDEPTNHLDMEAMAWLERTLFAWRGGILAVSHDRFFLDAIAKEIWELTPNGICQYPGNYSAYREQKAHQLKTQSLQFHIQQKEIRRQEEFIRKYQGGGWRIGEVHRREELLDKMEKIARPKVAKELPLEFHGRTRSISFALEADSLAVGYNPEDPLFTVNRLELVSGDRVAILGANGCGKTTLLRTVLKQLPVLEGRLRLNPGIRISYLSQLTADDDPNRTILAEMMSVGLALPIEARRHLARFLFTGDDAFKTLGQLSGGERKRLALAKMTFSDANLLPLDEPSNHLDTISREALESALVDYGGTILFVSHDRYLINRLANKLWLIENGGLQEFNGNYDTYLAIKNTETTQAKSIPIAVKSQVDANKTKKAELSEAQKLEAEIATLEQQLKQVEQELVRSGAETAWQQLGREYKSIQQALDDAYGRLLLNE